MAAHSNDLAFCIASSPCECIERSVSAVAMPEGKGSLSMLMSCRLSGTAMNTPRIDTAASQAIISHDCKTTGFSGSRLTRYSAGIADTSPADDMYPAALAALDIVLFSRIVNGSPG